MPSKNNSYFIPLAGVFTSSLLNWMFVQFWFADFFAKYMEVSRLTSYWVLNTLIFLMAIVRIVNILLRRDWITDRIDQFFDHQKKD